MKFYMAPMEGLTGYVYRSAYQRHFHNIDRYFTPFINNRKMNHRELADILPENNPGMEVVPQILTNRVEDFVEVSKELESYGYREVNLNLGCPSGTVVSKNRGAGFLSMPVELDRFLEGIFTQCPLPISIKTRIGKLDWEDWEELLAIYEKYPLTELIIHPRIQKDFYKNPVKREAFQMAVEKSRHSLCYNGDIFSVADYESLRAQFPGVDKVMLGRGLLKNPGLVGELKGEAAAVTRSELRAFHDEILEGYLVVMSGERNTLFRMKELWGYLGESFPDGEKVLKKIRKSTRLVDYRAAVDELFG
jgi:tRNA-dihydrouridine synthase